MSTRRNTRRAAEDFARTLRCPDCRADVTIAEPKRGVYLLDMRHDDTCPACRAMNGDGKP